MLFRSGSDTLDEASDMVLGSSESHTNKDMNLTEADSCRETWVHPTVL